MKQTTKFYLSSFLKNQTYFTPILIIFLQLNHLTYTEIFWVFTIGTIISFIAEIPTGIYADLYGKKQSIIIAKIGVFLAFILFGLSRSFWMFVLAQVIYELGNAFRTGTETAFIYDYLDQNKNEPLYKIVKANQKIYARIGEGIATAIGSIIVVSINSITQTDIGYNAVFMVAAIPAFANIINVISWKNIKQEKQKVNFKRTLEHTVESTDEVFRKKNVFLLLLNIALFASVLAALNKFIQPYMVNANVPIAYFGTIYTISLLLTALAVKYYTKIEDKFSEQKMINILTGLAIIPALILGLGYVSILGVILFFILVIIENIRSPIAQDAFNKQVTSKNRATTGSILSLGKSLGKLGILPLAGFFADAYSIYTAILIMSGFLIINIALFYVRKK